MNIRTLLTTATIAIVLASPAMAKIWRLSNVTGADADFTDFATAHNTAASGDTIYVEGSVTGYGTVTVSKQLIIIGPGYFLDENPETQENTNSANFFSVTFSIGSDGSVLTGCKLEGYTIYIYGSDIIIRGNYIYGYYGTSIGIGNNSNAVSNILISQNYIPYPISLATNSNPTGITIRNNYMTAITAPTTASVNLYNNVITGNIVVYTSVLNNNIMTGGTFTGDYNTYNNNLADGTQFGTDNGNQTNVNMFNEFLGAAGNSTDGQWQLKAGAVATGVGLTGEDCGMFGGSTPYALSGIIGIPSIFDLSTTGPGTTTGGLNVQIKATSH